MTAVAQKFEVTSLDLSGLTDEDLQSNQKSTSEYLKFLKEEGTHTFTIREVVRTADKVDGAGKKWGAVRILASADGEGATTGMIKTFLDIPLESATYTSQTGNSSKVKTQIFVRAVESVTGTKILTADIPNTVGGLDTILVPGATFRASVKYKNDRITRKDDSFYITLVDGTNMVDENNTELTFADYESAVAYYMQIKNRRPASGLEVVSYLSKQGA